MYERRHHLLLPRRLFFLRVGRHGLVAGAVLSVGLGVGIIGYHFIAHLAWIDSFLNAAMILGGMGPVDPLPNSAAKLFAGVYALFAGLAFVGVAGILLAPFVHRLLHVFHYEVTDEK